MEKEIAALEKWILGHWGPLREIIHVPDYQQGIYDYLKALSRKLENMGQFDIGDIIHTIATISHYEKPSLRCEILNRMYDCLNTIITSRLGLRAIQVPRYVFALNPGQKDVILE